MMAFPAPGPRFLCTQLAENADEIKFGIANRALTLLFVGQNLFQTHDRLGLKIAAMAQAGHEQSMG